MVSLARMADLPISQKPVQPSRQVTQIPDTGDGVTLFLVSVAALALGLLNVMLSIPFK
jgi:hypothetical protein